MSNDEFQAQEQWQKRLERNEKALSVALPSEMMIIDILLEIIRGNEQIIDEEELSSRLKQRGVNVQQQQLIYVLTYYDIKKTDHEIVKLIRSRIDRLSDSMRAYYLFPQKHTLYCYPDEHH